jgi:putative inorganic carbon (hco3(-)) transporter
VVDASTRISQLSHRAIVTLLLATVLIVPLLFSPHLSAWRGVKPVVFETLVLSLIALVLIPTSVPGSRQQLFQFLRRGPHQPILMLLLYSAVSWYRSPSHGFSGTEWLRLACGAGLYFVVATALRQRAQVRAIVNMLVAVTILTSLFGLIAYGQSDQTSMSASFGNGQLFSGFILILLPLLLVLALSEAELRHKIPAQMALALGTFGLLLAQTRSSWFGVLAALVVLGLLAWRTSSPASLGRLRHQIVVPLVIAVGAIGVFLVVSNTAPMVRARAASLGNATRDPSLDWRLERWKGAWRLIRERPLFGWGIGTFPLEQARTVRGAVPRDLILRLGPTLAEEAHNEYVQVTAEMGVFGLALYLWVLGAFFVAGWRALRERPHGFRSLVLMGCLAGIAGQTVDAFSNPAWRFADVSFLFWLTMGLGMAAARPQRSAPIEAAAAAPLNTSRRLRGLGWQGAVLTVTFLTMGGAWAERGFCPIPIYNGLVELRLQPPTVTLKPGECVQFHLMANINNNGFTDVTTSEDTRFFTRAGEQLCLANSPGVPPLSGAAPSSNVFCVPANACSTPACEGGRVVPVFATFGQPETTATARVLIDCPAIHDVSIVSLQVPAQVSRSADTEVQVTIANHGTQSENTELLLRVQPGRVVVADEMETLARGETKTVSINWPTPLMGDDGPKSLVAELFLKGAVDPSLADNQAIQPVIVGP